MRRLSPIMVTIACVAWWCDGELQGCSTHGQIQPISVTFTLTQLNSSGVYEGQISIVDELIAPGSPTNCVAGIGLGSESAPLPSGVNVTGASIAIVNQLTREATPLTQFNFTANATTTAGMSLGSSVSTEPQPIFASATWFGFLSPVSAFTAPTLGANEQFELQFDFSILPELLPIAFPVQFAAGEGFASGAPMFNGEHPITYFTAADPVVQLMVPEPGSLLIWMLIPLFAAGLLGAPRLIKPAAGWHW